MVEAHEPLRTINRPGNAVGAHAAAEEVHWNVYADPRDGRQKLAVFQERCSRARPHMALVAADSTTAPCRVLAPCEVYVKGYKVNPRPWCRWVGGLEKSRETEA